MNTILQKRIEEASIDYTMRTNPVCIAGDAFADMARELNKNPAFIAGANYVLQNQWISVKEALPPKRKTTKGEELEESIPVFVRDNEGNYTSAWYSFYGKHWYMAYGEAFLKQSIYSKITHWMEIPSLEGGEK